MFNCCWINAKSHDLPACLTRSWSPHLSLICKFIRLSWRLQFIALFDAMPLLWGGMALGTRWRLPATPTLSSESLAVSNFPYVICQRILLTTASMQSFRGEFFVFLQPGVWCVCVWPLLGAWAGLEVPESAPRTVNGQKWSVACVYACVYACVGKFDVGL